MKYKVFYLLIFLIFEAVSQSDSLNGFNKFGKKNGYWIEYLNENMQITDSLFFSYKRYQFYDDGKPIYSHKRIYVYPKSCKYDFSAGQGYDSKNKLLDGAVFSRSDQGDTIQIDCYKNGYPAHFDYTAFLYKNGIKDTGYIEKLFFKKLVDTSTVALYYEYWVNGPRNVMFLKKKRFYTKTKRGSWKYLK